MAPDLEDATARSDARWRAALCLATVAVTLLWWMRVEGTPFGDHVEYLERARGFVRGEPLIDAQPLRAIGVSLLYAPVVWIADALGLHLGPWLLGVAALLHAALACVFVLGAAAIARALAGRTGSGPTADGAGSALPWLLLAPAAVALTSPTFVRFGATAMTDIPSGAALAVGIERALFGPASTRRALQAGLFLGLSALFAFKSIPLIGLVFLAAAIARALESGPLRALRLAAATLAPIVALALVQAATDVYTYGRFGASIGTYLLINGGQVLAVYLMKLGLRDLAGELYVLARNAYEEGGRVQVEELSAAIDPRSSRAPADFYWTYFHELAARFFLAFGVLGAFVAARVALAAAGWRARAAGLVRALAPALAVLAFALISSVRGAKEMRLWLPLLPVLAAYAGVGVWRFASLGAGGPRLRGAAVLVAFAVAAYQCTGTMSAWPTNQRAAFADAARYLEELPPPARGGSMRVAASYNWAVLFRTPASVELVKLPHQLDRLKYLPPEDRAATLAALDGLDALVLHETLLRAQDIEGLPWASELYDAVARDFGVVAAFWDRSAGSGFGATLVLSRFADDGVRRGVLWRVDEGAAADPPDAPRAVRFERPIEGLVERLELSGMRAWRLPGDGLLWLELDLDRESTEWRVPHYLVRTAVRRPDGTGGFLVRGHPKTGKSNLKLLPPASRTVLGRLLAPYQGPLEPGAPPSDLEVGEPFHLFVDLASEARDDAGRLYVTGRLEALDPNDPRHAERDDLPEAFPATLRSDDGYLYSPLDGGLSIGAFDRFEPGAAARLEVPLAGE